MKNTNVKKNIIVIYIVLVFMMINVILMPYEYYHSPFKRALNFGICYTTMVGNIHEKTGRLIVFQDEFEKTMYYAYNPCHFLYRNSIRLTLNVKQQGKTLYFQRRCDYKFINWWSVKTVWTDDFDQNSDAKKNENYYLGGEKAVLEEVKYIRDESYSRCNKSIEQAENKVGLKQTPSSNKIFDLPRNKAELHEYIQFLKIIEGEDDLKDPWGIPLRFSIVGRKLTCESAGADKVFGTKDDIVTSVTVK